jgi:DNA invertase Pin-like site-specific DNA recombinase
MLNLLSGFSGDEYEAKKQRIKRGIKKARDNGEKWGRPAVDFDLDEAIKLKKDRYSWRQISEKNGVSYGTLRRYVGPHLDENDRKPLTKEEWEKESMKENRNMGELTI